MAFEAGVAERLEAAQPFADGVARAAEVAGSRLDPVGTGMGDDLVAERQAR